MEEGSPCEDFRQFCVQLQVTLRLSMTMFTGCEIRNKKGRREDTIAGGLRDHLEQVPSLAGGVTHPGKGPDAPRANPSPIALFFLLLLQGPNVQ